VTEYQFHSVMDAIMAFIFGLIGGFVVWALVPDARWWLIGGSTLFWGLVTYFGGVRRR
jgi:TM2 domain-containing membrane protein YozV